MDGASEPYGRCLVRRRPRRYISSDDTSPVYRISFPADTPASALVPLIEETMAPMFEMFRGYSTQAQQIDEMLTALIERRSQS